MLELGVGADWVRLIRAAYWLATVAAVIVAAWLPRRVPHKLMGIFIVVVAAVYLGQPHKQETEKKADSQESPAVVAFRKRCEAAKTTVKRTVDEVEGVELIGSPVPSSGEGKLDPNPLRQTVLRDYILSFLLYERENAVPRLLAYDDSVSSKPGYRFVEAVDPGDHARYRYTLGPRLSLVKARADTSEAAFSVTYEAPLISEDRELWIANDLIRVADRRTAEVVAETSRFVMDPFQGGTSAQRQPWSQAVSCTGDRPYGIDSVRLFVDQVLRPKKNERR